jgi:hypothetical protein
MKILMKTSILMLILTQGCGVTNVKQPTYLSSKQEAWKSEILGKCVDKAHELTYLVWQDNKFLDVEQLTYIEKRFQDKCVVQNNLAI